MRKWAGLIVLMALLSACSPVRDRALYVVDGVRMEITRDRTLVDTSGAQVPASTETAGTVVLGPTAVSRGMLIRRADGEVVTELDRPRAEAALRLYCAASGNHAPPMPLIFDRPVNPVGFFGICRSKKSA